MKVRSLIVLGLAMVATPAMAKTKEEVQRSVDCIMAAKTMTEWNYCQWKHGVIKLPETTSMDSIPESESDGVASYEMQVFKAEESIRRADRDFIRERRLYRSGLLP